MKLTYFVSPYDLINEENRTYDTLNPDTIIKRKIGHSVTVCMEGSTGHKLPTSSIITVNRSPTGKRYVRSNFIYLLFLYTFLVIIRTSNYYNYHIFNHISANYIYFILLICAYLTQLTIASFISVLNKVSNCTFCRQT